MAYAEVSFTISGKQEDIDRALDAFCKAEKLIGKRHTKVNISRSINTEYAEEKEESPSG